MGKPKNANKKLANDKQPIIHYPVVTSDVCEKCSDKCVRGVRYVENLRSTGRGNGCVCKKVGK